VLEVLQEIGAAATTQILVLTKTDLLDSREDPLVLARRLPGGAEHAVAVSARSGAGVDALLAKVDELLPVDRVSKAWFRFPATAGAERHVLFEYARVIEEEWVDEDCFIHAEVPDSVRGRLSEFLTPRYLPGSARR
jgi:GTP-binding protein HflX